MKSFIVACLFFCISANAQTEARIYHRDAVLIAQFILNCNDQFKTFSAQGYKVFVVAEKQKSSTPTGDVAGEVKNSYVTQVSMIKGPLSSGDTKSIQIDWSETCLGSIKSDGGCSDQAYSCKEIPMSETF